MITKCLRYFFSVKYPFNTRSVFSYLCMFHLPK